MMRPAFLIILAFTAFLVSCSGDGPSGVESEVEVLGTVVVFVHWQDKGLADMRVELVEPGIELKTDGRGIAEFIVPAGRYTVRAYDINQGGPALQYVDTEIVLEPQRSVRVEIVDCLPCV
jgi:hypothetical protein